MNAEQIAELMYQIENAEGSELYSLAIKACMALDAARKERQWQPIESAPKDGARILIAGHWGGNPDAPRFVAESCWVEGDWDRHNKRHDLVTHWQPLPPPPDAEERK